MKPRSNIFSFLRIIDQSFVVCDLNFHQIPSFDVLELEYNMIGKTNESLEFFEIQEFMIIFILKSW